jgi:protein O-mannosyl-transferase
MSRRLNHLAKNCRGLVRQQGMVMMVCGLLALMVLVVFWQCRGFAFVNFDDNVLVYGNKHVLKGLTWQNVCWSMTAGIGEDATDADFWRPVSFMSHMLDVSLFGLNAGAHHMMSVALHLLATVALFLVLKAMTGRLWCSAFVAAFFAVHPLHVESVAWVAERKDVLSGLFFVLTLGAYLHYVRKPFQWGRYLLVLLLGALALMSKPMLVTLPCVLLLLDHWPLGRTKTVPAQRLLAEKIPLFLMVLMVSGLTLALPRLFHDEMWAALPWYYHSGNAVLSYGVYIRQTLWPTGLTCFYLFPGSRLNFGHVAISAVVLAAITSLAWWRRRKPGALVGWLWYLGMLMPVIGMFVQAGGQAHADRYTYLAMIGLSLMVVWPAADWAGTKATLHGAECHRHCRPHRAHDHGACPGFILAGYPQSLGKRRQMRS